MSNSRQLLTIAVVLGLSTLGARNASGTVPADLCAGDPCTVNANKVVDSGSDLDFGTADLVIAANVQITVGPAAPQVQPTLTLRAASITMLQGSKIEGPGAAVTLISTDPTTGAITLQSAGLTRSIVDVGENSAGSITIQAATNAVIGGRLLADGNGEDAAGGAITVTAGGAVSTTELINAGATGAFSFGGDVSITGGTGVTLNGEIDISGGGSDGGFLEITAATGDVLMNRLINANGGDPDGFGGLVDIIATTGDIISTAPGEIRGRGGAGIDESCGDGSEVNLSAGGDLTVGGPINARGGLQCLGGDITLTATGNLNQLASGSIDSFGPGGFGSGGSFRAEVGGNATFNDVGVNSTSFGGEADVIVLGSATFNGLFTAASTSIAFSTGGTIDIQACNLIVSPTGDLDARGNFPFPDFGVVTLRSGGPLVVQGRVRAEARVELRYKTILPDVTGTIDPDPLVFQDPTLPECVLGGPQCNDSQVTGEEICDDGNNSSCDGCRADCTRFDDVCGDSITECGEQCDDGNSEPGDGCEPDCTVPGLESLRLPGYIRPTEGCFAEWDIKMSNARTDPAGIPLKVQECIDGDPRCDADKVKDGDCEAELKVCVRVADPRLPACSAPPIARVQILHPVPSLPDAFNRENAVALRDAVLALGSSVRVGDKDVQTGPPIEAFDTCTESFRLRAPIRFDSDRPDSRRAKLRALGTNGVGMDSNPFKLRCFRNNAVCGNGLIEISESCEDGNTTSCDGCSSQCQIEACGNGILECDEACDEGPLNGTPDSSCTTMCTEAVPDLRIPGGGPAAKDCAWQWSMLIDPSKVVVTRDGRPSTKQSCTDNDPTCDLDATAGRCRLRLWGCVGEPNTALGCGAAMVTSAGVRIPRATTKRLHEQQGRAALLQAIAALGLPKGPSTIGQTCRSFEVDVPATRRALTFKVQSTFGADSDIDKLKLRCVTP